MQGAPGVYVGDRKEADVFEEVQTFNDHGKILAGVHENFLAVRFNDPTLAKVRCCLYCIGYRISGIGYRSFTQALSPVGLAAVVM